MDDADGRLDARPPDTARRLDLGLIRWRGVRDVETVAPWHRARRRDDAVARLTFSARHRFADLACCPARGSIAA